ncbi:MAG: phosphoglycolate phosphatase [Nitratiruptor sp.]|nr:phosphoglycolate phosphatase [Nitratiruptor sp.]NPA83705.1 phosphoglycolate phosphatase [Campylobacterota bacterium]
MELIIFDLDGTLIDSAPDLARSVNFMLARLGREPFDEATIRTWVGNGAKMLVHRALSGSKEPKPLSHRLLKEALEIFLEHYEKNLVTKTTLYPGVKETLESLSHKKLAIATNKPERFVRPILQTLEIDLFDIVVGGDTLHGKKPDPAMLHYILDRSKTTKALMVGDSKNDILAAQQAQLPCVAVTYGYNQGEDLQALGPDYLIHHFAQLEEIVDV